MLKRLKRFYRRNLIEKYLKERDVSQRNTTLKHLGFLVDGSFFDDYEVLFAYGQELGLHRKDIKVFSFVESKRKIPSLRQDQVTNNEFNWRGEIIDQNAIDFLDSPFDVLIGLYHGKHDYMDIMVARSKARFKIGFQDAEVKLYDLILNIDFEEEKLFKKEVSSYLKAFKKI